MPQDIFVIYNTRNNYLENEKICKPYNNKFNKYTILPALVFYTFKGQRWNRWLIIIFSEVYVLIFESKIYFLFVTFSIFGLCLIIPDAVIHLIIAENVVFRL